MGQPPASRVFSVFSNKHHCNIQQIYVKNVQPGFEPTIFGT